MVETTAVRSRTRELKIGKITYIISTHYNENSAETAEDKLLQIVTNRISNELKSSHKSVI